MEAKVTFVMPSMCRGSLSNSLDSLRAQSDGRWKAIVCFDHCGPTIESDERISAIRFDGDSGVGPDCRYCIKGRKSSAGVVRNYAMERVETEWVAFLDDDDVVTGDYVQRLLEESERVPDSKAIVFRMLVSHGRPRFVPSPWASHNNFKHGSVGISFAMRRELFPQCRFARGRGEDFVLLSDIKSRGGLVLFSHYMTYLVRYGQVTPTALEFKSRIEKIPMRSAQEL